MTLSSVARMVSLVMISHPDNHAVPHLARCTGLRVKQIIKVLAEIEANKSR